MSPQRVWEAITTAGASVSRPVRDAPAGSADEAVALLAEHGVKQLLRWDEPPAHEGDRGP